MKNLNTIYKQINELMDLVDKVKTVLEIDGYLAFKIVNDWVNSPDNTEDKETKENNILNVTVNCENCNKNADNIAQTIAESLKKLGK